MSFLVLLGTMIPDSLQYVSSFRSVLQVEIIKAKTSSAEHRSTDYLSSILFRYDVTSFSNEVASLDTALTFSSVISC